MCDSRFTERNAQVVCRDLGLDPLHAFFDFDVRIDFHSNSLTRIWTWPEPLQCKGIVIRLLSIEIKKNIKIILFQAQKSVTKNAPYV